MLRPREGDSFFKVGRLCHMTSSGLPRLQERPTPGNHGQGTSGTWRLSIQPAVKTLQAPGPPGLAKERTALQGLKRFSATPVLIRRCAQGPSRTPQLSSGQILIPTIYSLHYCG